MGARALFLDFPVIRVTLQINSAVKSENYDYLEIIIFHLPACQVKNDNIHEKKISPPAGKKRTNFSNI
jgi:hypothetical protein